jgi:hypothetical protein
MSKAQQAREAAIAEILEKTGAESIDDVLSAWVEYQGIQEAVMTEADRANQRAERLEKRAKAAEERYERTVKEYALLYALKASGVKEERLHLALKLADMEHLSVSDSGKVDGIEVVVEDLKEAIPEWFGESHE